MTKIKDEIKCCNRCDRVVSVSENKEYAYQCNECDEDLYEFETHSNK